MTSTTPLPKITLYLAPGACSLAPHILLHEASLANASRKIDFTVTNVTASVGYEGLQSAEFLRLNPKARVPVLVLNYDGKDEVITESPAIFTALSQLFPEQKWLGEGGLATVRAYEWMNWISGTMHGMGFGMLVRPARFTTSSDRKALDEVYKKGHETFGQCLAQVEKKLEGREWALGDSFSAVDAYLFPIWRWGNEERFGYDMEKSYSRYTALVKKLAERPAVKEALKKEGIEL